MQYRGGYHNKCRGYHEYRGVFSTVGGYLEYRGDILITVEDVQYRGDIMMHVRDSMSTVGMFSIVGDS